MKLGHISDLHILELRNLRPWHFANKRVVGSLNLLLKRSKSHSTDVVHKALDQLSSLDVDHIAITGDLTNLALPSEFEAARRVVDDISGALNRVSVIPGNHDYYTPDAKKNRRFETFFADYLVGDVTDYTQPSGYPFCKIRGDVAIIGLNSAIVSPPMYATGRVRERELDATRALLADPKVRERFIVVMIHHHLLPFEHSRVEYLRRLTNAKDVLRVLREGNVDLAIHGHNHHFSTVELPHLGGPGVLRICEAGSTSTTSYTTAEFGGKFNVYHIDDGHLAKIETHLFEAHEGDFVRWHEQVFEQRFDDDET